MTNLLILKPSLSTTTRDTTYMVANGFDIGRDPQYPLKIELHSSPSGFVRVFVFQWLGISHSNKQTFESTFELEKNIGSCYLYDQSEDSIFFEETLIKAFLTSTGYIWTEANLWSIEATFKEDL